MSSYAPLTEYLRDHAGTRWEASFSDIERILGRPLPRSAYQHQAWWANQAGPGHSQTKGWKGAGWRTTKLDLDRRRVAFERTSTISTDSDRDKLLATAIAITGIADHDEIIDRALRVYVYREAVESLSELSGTMPDAWAPERERPWG